VPPWKPREEGLFCSIECSRGFYAGDAPPRYDAGAIERFVDRATTAARRPFLHCSQCLRPIPLWQKPVRDDLCSDGCAVDRDAGRPEKMDENRARRAHELGNIFKGLACIPVGIVLSVICFPAWAILCLIGFGMIIMGLVNWSRARPWAPHMEVPVETPSSDFGGGGSYSTYTTVSKSCGRCGRSVSNSLSAGDSCPHCGAFWSGVQRHES